MPSLVPLNNAIAQNSVDFNNQNPTNKGGLSRYKITNYGQLNYGAVSQHAFTNADLNSVCIFSGDVDITFQGFNFNPAPLPGAEILFYSTNGRIRLNDISALLYSNVGNFTVPTKAGKIIYTSAGKWYFSSLNTAVFSPILTDCCGVSPPVVYQVGNNNSGSLDPNIKLYVDPDATFAFNGIVYDTLDEQRYIVINGQATGDGMTVCDTPAVYSSEYTFYSSASTTATFYSLTGAFTPDNYYSLLGIKFFSSIPNEGNPINSCWATDVVAPGSPATYYGSTEQYPDNYVVFLNGYVIDYDGIPYKGL